MCCVLCAIAPYKLYYILSIAHKVATLSALFSGCFINHWITSWINSTEVLLLFFCHRQQIIIYICCYRFHSTILKCVYVCACVGDDAVVISFQCFPFGLCCTHVRSSRFHFAFTAFSCVFCWCFENPFEAMERWLNFVCGDILFYCLLVKLNAPIWQQ